MLMRLVEIVLGMMVGVLGIALGLENLGARSRANDLPPLACSPFTAQQAKEFQQQWAKYLGRSVEFTNSLGMKMVLIPPGEFVMGRTEAQFDEWLRRLGADPTTSKTRGGFISWSMLMMPAHRVRITKPFYLGASEVTVGQFRQFCEATGYRTEAERGLEGGVPYQGKRPLDTWRLPRITRELGHRQQADEPVLHLTWQDCVEFCRWLSQKEGAEYCLPTEAEWEYACRAGTTTPWHFGDWNDLDKVAHEYAYWSEGRQGEHKRPRAVAQGKPNAFGLYDMHGNVWEYVADWWHEMYYKESPLNDPTGPEAQHERGDLRRIIRGSSYDWGSAGGDAAYRMRITQHSGQHPHQGFRVAMRLANAPRVPPAPEPKQEWRHKVLGPGANSPEVVQALKAGTGVQLPRAFTIHLGGGSKMEFALIPAGTFLMGSQKGPADERPVHRVVISRPFYLAKFPLTQGQWQAVMGKDARLQALQSLWSNNPDAIGPEKVMVGLNWYDCQELVRRLADKAPDLLVDVHEESQTITALKADSLERFGLPRRLPFDLPTEAQWEYACRAGTNTEFCFGDDASQLGEYAWFEGNMIWPGKHGNTSRAAYPSVGQKKPNPWGLYDMHGCVWEWCKDWYDPDYYLHSPLADPQGPATGRFKVLRGGSWFRYGQYARSAYRRFYHPEQVEYITAWIQDFGCRLVINLPDTQPPAQKSDLPPPRDDKQPTNLTRLARSLVRYSHNPVLKTGMPGAWNDRTLGCFSVVDLGDRFLLFTEGARFGQAKQIGVASSRDGIHWQWWEKNPLFGGSMPYAIKVGDVLRLYYSGTEAGRDGLYLRLSRDGVHWSEPQRVFHAVADPKVVQVSEKRFHLYYCHGGKVVKDGKAVWEFKNYVAISEDGIHWKQLPEPVLPLGPKGSWDEFSHAGPCVLKLEDGFHMFYLGSGRYRGDKIAWRAGHATSPDGITWTKSGTEPVLDIGRPGDWDGGTLMSISVVFRAGKFHFWYAADPGEHTEETKMSMQIGYSTSR